MVVVHKNITLLAVSLMNCLQHICGISLCDHVPNIDILNRCNNSSVESQLQSKSHILSGCLKIDCQRSFCLVKSRGGASGLVSMMLHLVTFTNAASLGHTKMLRTDCLGEIRLVLHVPSST